MNPTGVPTAWITTDDTGLIFLNSSANTDTGVKNLQGNATALRIQELVCGAELKANYGYPATDPAVPDIIVRPKLGTCYMTPGSKIAEHGGLSDDDRDFGYFVSYPNLAKTVYSDLVNTTMIAHCTYHSQSIGPPGRLLKDAIIEGTKPLMGFQY